MERFSPYCLILAMLMTTPIKGLPQFRLFVYGGPAMSAIRYSTAVETDGVTGLVKHEHQKPLLTFNGGLALQFKAGKYFEMRSGVEFFQKGWKINYFQEGSLAYFELDQFLRKYKLNYLQVPLTLIYATPIGIGKLYVGFGPYVALALNGKVSTVDQDFRIGFQQYNEYIYEYTPDDHSPIRYITHYTANRFDYGINSSIGYELAFGVFVQVRYDVGLRQISTSSERYSVEWQDIIQDLSVRSKYSIFQLSMGILINRKK